MALSEVLEVEEEGRQRAAGKIGVALSEVLEVEEEEGRI